MKEKIFGTFFYKIASAVFNFIVVILLSQFLGAAGRGEASIISVTLSIVLIFTDFSGGGALIYLVPRYSIKSLLITAYLWSLIVSIISYFVLDFFWEIHKEFVIHIAVIVFLMSLGGANTRTLIGKQKLEKSNFVQFVQVFIIFITLLILFLILNLRSIQSYIIALYTSAIVVGILSFSFIIKDILKEKASPIRFLFKETLNFGSKNQIAHISQFISYRASYYIIERYWGIGMVGIYSNAVSIAESIWIFSRSISLVQLSKITNSQDEQYNRSLTVQLMKYTLLITVLLLIPLLILPGSFYAYFFGPEFISLPGIIMTLAPGVIFYSIALIFGHYFSGMGQYGINVIASMVGLVITLIFGFVLIPYFSILGAGVTSSISYLSTAIIVGIIFFKNDKSSWTQILPDKSDLAFKRWKF